MTKNKHADQETVNADSGCNFTVSINCCVDYEVVVNSMSAFMSTGKIKVTDHSIKFDKVIKLKERFFEICGASRGSPLTLLDCPRRS